MAGLLRLLLRETGSMSNSNYNAVTQGNSINRIAYYDSNRILSDVEVMAVFDINIGIDDQLSNVI